MTPIDDNELMLKAGKGDRRAFEKIYEQYFTSIANFFYKLCWNSAESEEWAQEVFLRLWRSKEDYRAVGKFSTYLFQIAKNYWINEIRRESRQPKSVSLSVESEDEEKSFEPESPQERPVEQSEARETIEIVREAVEALPEIYKMPFILSRYQDFKYKEIAEILDVAPRTIEWRVAEAFRILETKLGRILKQ